MRGWQYIAAITALAMLSVAYAGVFVYYPINVSLSPVNPPIVFAQGINAGQSDLGGGGTPYTSNIIVASPGSNGASLSITLHPTYQHNYYYNLSLIINNDGKAYYITFRVLTAMTLPAGSAARLIIFNAPSGGSKVADVNLLATGDTSATAPIPAGGKWRIDIYILIPEGSTLPSSASATLQLIYSPETGVSPPSVPPP
ncbi:MAG: hypothetical protein QXI64_10405 [Sulfolobales archaeon]